MDPKLKKILRGISLEIRRLLEGRYDEHGLWQAGDLERRLNELGLWRDRNPKPVEELPHLSPEDKAARRLVDGYLKLREEAGVGREEAVSEFVRESAYTWANRLFALRCMEARSIIDEVILQKDSYGGRSLAHFRFAKRNPDACAGNDDGLLAVLFAEFAQRAQELPLLFDPNSPAVALRPSIAALKRTIALLSGRETARGLDAATDQVFAAPDAFGWAYQYWNADEKDRVFAMVRTKNGSKIQGADIIPATQLYTEPYMVKFLVQNSLGALWMVMYPDSNLCDQWEYYVKHADRAPVKRKPVREITFLDPAQGSGHFHLEAFDLFYAMYEEEAAREGRTLTPRGICAAILNQNLYGIDIDGRSVQIATAALWMKAKERAPDLEAGDLTSFHEHLVATNIRLPRERNHLELFLQKHPEDEQLRPALELVFQGLEHADELGALLQIEELVDAVLRRLKEEADKSKGTAVQTGLFEPTLRQTTRPVSVEDYDKWKRDALDRLQAHFESEAQAADPVQAFFGESAGKGLTFFNLLARRYDVVAANPPYMGSKNMGDELKAYVKHHFAPGKRDLYAAFILRCVEFAQPAGRVAMVTQQSWMFLGSYAQLRNETDHPDRPGSEKEATKGLLRDSAIEVLAHLGRYAFSEIGNAHVQPVPFVLCNQTPSSEHRLWACRLTSPRASEVQASLLRAAAGGTVASAASGETSDLQVFRSEQRRFLDVPQSPVCYWLRDRFFELLAGTKLSDVAQMAEPTTTGNSERFFRGVWEISSPMRWFVASRGGGYAKWTGLKRWALEWEHQGARVKASSGSYVRNEVLMFKEGLTYTEAAYGALGCRLLDRGETFCKSGPGIFLHRTHDGYLAVLNSHIPSFFLRITARSFMFGLGDLGRVPVAGLVPVGISSIENACVSLKRRLLSTSLTERDTDGAVPCSRSMSECFHILAERANAVAASLHSLEAVSERLVFDAYGLNADDAATVANETGSPAGWFPLLAGYDALPPLPAGLPELPHEVFASLEHHERRLLSSAELVELKRRLRQLYEAGRGGSSADDEPDLGTEENDEEEETLGVGARLPIPAETFIEELSQKLEVHPISMCWLLKEGTEGEGWRCPQEERRLTEDRFTVLVLRLLGHRWPKQLGVGEPLPAWADQDGVIPLTSGGGETPLIERLRERLAEEFPGGNVAALEREFQEIVGVPLERWLSGPFFERHISQFKKRPIAWQVETEVRGQRSEVRGKGKAKKRAKSPPVFACLVYCHKLDAGLLPKLRTHYVGVLQGGYETELRTLERLANPTAEQQGRKLQLDQWIEEMKAFDAKLEQVSLTGFGPAALRPALRQYAINDALLSLTACWLRRLDCGVRSGKWVISTPHPGLLPDRGGEGKRSVAGDSALATWQDAAAVTKLHADLPWWIGDAFSRLDYFCTAIGPQAPGQETLANDPTSGDLAPLVCASPSKIVSQVLELACERWWQQFDESVLRSLKEQLKEVREEQERVKEELELDEVKRDYARQNALADRKDELKREISSLREEIGEKTDKGKQLRSQIESWTCLEAATWEDWLGTQPLFDAIASLDGKRKAPATIGEFIAQESAYAPDINDGVRVNIAPIQRAGLLHSDVLDSKDADKAIADRAEWRADERRWVREGKLPQPGWWEITRSTT